VRHCPKLYTGFPLALQAIVGSSNFPLAFYGLSQSGLLFKWQFVASLEAQQVFFFNQSNPYGQSLAHLLFHVLCISYTLPLVARQGPANSTEITTEREMQNTKNQHLQETLTYDSTEDFHLSTVYIFIFPSIIHPSPIYASICPYIYPSLYIILSIHTSIHPSKFVLTSLLI